MEDEIKMQELITRYIDGDVTPEEKLKAEEALKYSESLRLFYKDLVTINAVLAKIPLEETSPDWERKVKASLEGESPLGGRKMNKMSLVLQAVPKKQLAVICIILLVSFFSIQTYVGRGIQGRLKLAADDIGDQFSVGNTRVYDASMFLDKNTSDLGKTLQYEPYYLRSQYTATRSEEGQGASTANPADIQGQYRMLIRKADYTVSVEDCDKVFLQINELIRRYNGIVIESRIEESSNGIKNGVAVFKVLPEKFDAALQSLDALGTIESKNVTGNDVTEEYVDLDARLKNQQNVRARLQAILDQRTSRMDEVLRVEQEIARVSENIERIEGKLKYYDREVAMSTITIHYHEKYKEAAAVWSLDFINKFKNTLKQAAEIFVSVFNGGIVIAAMVIPFVLWIFIASLVVFGIQKLLFRKKV